MTANKPHLTLYSREYCHLCQDMLVALQALRDERGGSFEIDVVDIDADQAALARFDELVPVLVAFEGEEILELCHYFLDTDAVLTYLGALGDTM